MSVLMMSVMMLKTVKKNAFEISPSRNHDLITQDNSQTSLCCSLCVASQRHMDERLVLVRGQVVNINGVLLGRAVTLAN